MDINKQEQKALKYILAKLVEVNDVETSIIITCPFPSRSCNSSCGAMFPALRDHTYDDGRLPCPCYGMIDGHISLQEAIDKIIEVLKTGEIKEE